MKRKQYRPGRGMVTAGTMLVTNSAGYVDIGIFDVALEREMLSGLLAVWYRGRAEKWLERRRINTPKQLQRSPNFSKMTAAERQILERAK